MSLTEKHGENNDFDCLVLNLGLSGIRRKKVSKLSTNYEIEYKENRKLFVFLKISNTLYISNLELRDLNRENIAIWTAYSYFKGFKFVQIKQRAKPWFFETWNIPCFNQYYMVSAFAIKFPNIMTVEKIRLFG